MAAHYQNLILIRPDGEVIAAAKPLPPRANLAKDLAVAGAMQGQSFAVGVSSEAAANAGQCCAAEDAAHAGASRTILGPCMSALGCKGTSAALAAIAVLPALPWATIGFRLFETARVEAARADDARWMSRPLEAESPPPR